MILFFVQSTSPWQTSKWKFEKRYDAFDLNSEPENDANYCTHVDFCTPDSFISKVCRILSIDGFVCVNLKAQNWPCLLFRKTIILVSHGDILQILQATLCGLESYPNDQRGTSSEGSRLTTALSNHRQYSLETGELRSLKVPKSERDKVW